MATRRAGQCLRLSARPFHLLVRVRKTLTQMLRRGRRGVLDDLDYSDGLAGRLGDVGPTASAGTCSRVWTEPRGVKQPADARGGDDGDRKKQRDALEWRVVLTTSDDQEACEVENLTRAVERGAGCRYSEENKVARTGHRARRPSGNHGDRPDRRRREDQERAGVLSRGRRRGAPVGRVVDRGARARV